MSCSLATMTPSNRSARCAMRVWSSVNDSITGVPLASIIMSVMSGIVSAVTGE